MSLHCPATPETRHLMNASGSAACGASAFLINTARGDVVDEAALVEALERDASPAPASTSTRSSPWSRHCSTMENVVLLPHLGSATRRPGWHWARASTTSRLFRGEVDPHALAVFVELLKR